jgi:hypothetical protein
MIEPKNDHITILGMQQSTLDLFNVPQNADHETWAIGHHTFGRAVASRVFEAHELPYIKRKRFESTYVRHWLRDLYEAANEKPVYTLHDFPFRLGRYHQTYRPQVRANSLGLPYIESTIGYMLAAALDTHRRHKLARVSIFGVSFVNSEEYGYQRPNSMYLIGRLEEAGVEVFVPPSARNNLFGSAWPKGVYGLLENLGPLKPNINYEQAS